MTIRRSRRGRAVLVATFFASCAVALPRVASAATYYYVDCTEANVAGGTASGTITLPDSSTVTVTFAAIKQDSSPGSLYGAQINDTGTNYWNPSAPYISSEVANAPPTPDILQLSGGQGETYVVTLSAPIKDPIMAIVSLGSPGTSITYNFDSPFTIVSQGAGYFGGSSTALVQLPNNVLQGTEGDGTLQFIGTFSTFSWTVPTPETWHGFTFGIRTTVALEPGDGGAVDGAVDGAASDASPDGSVLDGAVSEGGATDGAVDGAVSDASATDAATVPPVDASADAAVVVADASADGGTVGTEAGGAVEDATVIGGFEAGAGNADASEEVDATESDAGADASDNLAGGGPSDCSCSTVGGGSAHEALPIGALFALAGLAGGRRRKRNR